MLAGYVDALGVIVVAEGNGPVLGKYQNRPITNYLVKKIGKTSQYKVLQNKLFLKYIQGKV